MSGRLGRWKRELFGGIPAATNTDVVVPIPALAVTSITPTHAGAYGYLRVRGTGFSHAGLGASYNLTNVVELVVISDTELTIILPDIGQPSGSYDLSISFGGGPGQTVHTQFTYDSTALPAPTLTSVNYSTGDVLGGGQAIVLTGTNCSTVTSVTICGASVAPTSTTSTTVTFTLPAHAAGTGTISVTSPGGTSGTLPFEYFNPTSVVDLYLDSTNYATGGGSATWTARKGGNAVGGTSQFGTVSTSGRQLGGRNTIDQHGVALAHLQVPTLSNYFSVSSWFGLVLFAPDAIGADNATPYNEVMLFTDAGGGNFGLSLSDIHGIEAYDWHGGPQIASTGVVPTTGVWIAAMAKHEAGQLSARSGSGGWTSTAALICSGAGSTLHIGANYNSSLPLDGRIAVVAMAITPPSDANITKLIGVLNQQWGTSL